MRISVYVKQNKNTKGPVLAFSAKAIREDGMVLGLGSGHTAFHAVVAMRDNIRARRQRGDYAKGRVRTNRARLESMLGACVTATVGDGIMRGESTERGAVAWVAGGSGSVSDLSRWCLNYESDLSVRESMIAMRKFLGCELD